MLGMGSVVQGVKGAVQGAVQHTANAAMNLLNGMSATELARLRQQMGWGIATAALGPPPPVPAIMPANPDPPHTGGQINRQQSLVPLAPRNRHPRPPLGPQPQRGYNDDALPPRRGDPRYRTPGYADAHRRGRTGRVDHRAPPPRRDPHNSQQGTYAGNPSYYPQGDERDQPQPQDYTDSSPWEGNIDPPQYAWEGDDG